METGHNGQNGHNGTYARSMYDGPIMKWERVPTTIPHVWIEHITLEDREVLIVNDELGGFDMDTQCETVRYSIIENTFPETRQMGRRQAGCIEVHKMEAFKTGKGLTV